MNLKENTCLCFMSTKISQMLARIFACSIFTVQILHENSHAIYSLRHRDKHMTCFIQFNQTTPPGIYR